MRGAGFTLVEMLVVLAVLALIMALLPPLLEGGQGRAELAAAAREIAASLRETRSLALRDGRSESFAVDGRAGTFRAGVAGRLRHLPAGLRLTLDRPGGDAPVTAGEIRFFADGSSSGGGLQLAQGGRRSHVAVDWLTGRVSLDAAR
jgi:general secretion pathway protein H